jgi:hypothetical protein
MIRGSCLCGGIQIEAERVPLITNCHCSKCRKAHGAAFRSGAIIPISEFRFVWGRDLVAQHRTPSGYTASFCRVCGSNAPAMFEDRQIVSVPAGLFDDDPGARPALHIFVGSKAPWWSINDDLPQFDEWVPGYGPEDRG